MELKICSKCKKEKNIKEFPFDKSKSDGRYSSCKKCKNESANPYYEKNRKKIIRKMNEWRNKNRERHRENNRRRKKAKRKNDPCYVLKQRVSCSIRRAFRENNVTKIESSFKMLGYEPKKLYEHLARYLEKPCKICQKKIITLENSHIDHIKPISLAKTKDEIIELNQLDNLQLLCADCNHKKSDSFIDPEKVKERILEVL